MSDSIGDTIAFRVHYIRTDGDFSGAYPAITVVHTKRELEQYYAKWRDDTGFARSSAQGIVQGIAQDSSAGQGNGPGFAASALTQTPVGGATEFADAVQAYTDAYFDENYLVILRLMEGSGSVRHTVERIEENGDIIISRTRPEIGTADMAEWHILIGISRVYQPPRFNPVMENMVITNPGP